jgi:LysR family transcriptional regulator, cyn operon transcriptional activator
MIELRHLRYFLEVARHEHITRAAQALHVTQSTLSHQIVQLEALLGTPLFDRVGRGLQLTDAGRTFSDYARRALEEVEEGRYALDGLRDLLRGRVRIGVIHTYNTTLLPPAIAEFARSYPGIHVSIEDMPAPEVAAMVASGAIHLGLSFATPGYPDVDTEELFSERLMLVVRDDHPLAGNSSVHAEALSRLRLAVQTERFLSRRMIDAELGQWIHGSIWLEMSSIDAMLATIRLQGQTAALLFERAISESSGLRQIEIVQPQVTRTAAILWRNRRARSRAATEIAAAVRRHCIDAGLKVILPKAAGGL